VVNRTPHAEGAAALRYHGMLHGLSTIMGTAPVTKATPPRPHEHIAHALHTDSEFLRLLANLVLRTHSELAHVY
jgi:hypothetical protein